ncbi:collagen-like protein [Streptomyces sp. NPDC059176]|uniref:collagen-like triple helix repeat-containing protein n=1 Tax=Streptomyces sp. NPDC059176 TaxID=3346758 RepID=UPI0036A4F987
MPLPPGLSAVTVSGTYTHPDGTAFKGKLLFTPEPPILTSGANGLLLLGTVEATLDESGAFSVTLLATDDADVTPTDWTYLVQERWYNAPGRSYPLSLPAAAPAVDLADVAPTAPAEGVYVVVTGPAGPTGATGATGPAGPTGPQGPQGEPGSEADAQAYTDAAVTALTGTVTTLSGDVSSLDTFVQDCLTRVAAIEQGTAFLTAVNTSLLNVASRHTLDGTNDLVGFHGVPAVARQGITGSRSDGTALAALLTALHTLGLITDNTTA